MKGFYMGIKIEFTREFFNTFLALVSRGGTEPGSARLGSARLASIRGKSSGKARLGAGSKIFGS